MSYLIFAGPEGDMLNEDGRLIPTGERFEVSDERAEQLLADPHVAVYPAPEDDLHKLTRPKLDELASQAGLDPQQYPSKSALVDALTNPPAAIGEGQPTTDLPPQEA